MRFTRRSVVGGTLAGAGLAAGGLLVRRVPGPNEVRRLARGAASPALPEAEPGPIEEATLHTLLAVARALVDGAARSPRYAELFRSRAERVPGYLRLYRRFARRLERESATSAGRPVAFEDLPPERARRLVDRLAPPGRLARLTLGLAGDERALFRARVSLEVLELYAATDAWTALGYGAWPGRPRGLRDYRQPPPGARGSS